MRFRKHFGGYLDVSNFSLDVKALSQPLATRQMLAGVVFRLFERGGLRYLMIKVFRVWSWCQTEVYDIHLRLPPRGSLTQVGTQSDITHTRSTPYLTVLVRRMSAAAQAA